jgi:hypothetical protein
MKRILTIYLFTLISFSVVGQHIVSDSIVYFLVEQTIEDIEKTKIFKHLRIPSLPLKINEEGGIGKNFTQQDTAFVKYQIVNPVVRIWEKK